MIVPARRRIVSTLILTLEPFLLLAFRGSRTPIARQQRSLFVSPHLSAFFEVGDSVLVNSTNKNEVGVIEEVRGSGWYSVAVGSENHQEFRKCRSSQLQPILQPSATTAEPNDEILASIPTVIDYDQLDSDTHQYDPQLLRQLQTFRNYTHWVVFSDLHVSPTTLETCLQVLDTVHSAAVERQAGILFLGDFWHVRGTLRVSTLNAVLERLRQWTVPWIALPGNHDQCAWETNTNHALQPFQGAYRIHNNTVDGVWLVSSPCIFQQALLVPHIKDAAVLSSVLQEAGGVSAVNAILCHADCGGASRNDRAISAGGVRVTDFPVPAYSGHYHAPQVLQDAGCRLEYVGSPYQVTLSEANEEKRFLVMESGSWTCVEEIPVDLGRKHYLVQSVAELKTLQAHAGDRVVASFSKHDLEQSQEYLDKMRTDGITVEVRKRAVPVFTSTPPPPTIPTEEMDPLSVWKQFVEMKNRTDLEDIGAGILGEVERSSSVSTKRVSVGNCLEFESVSLQGFGPFAESVTYPLGDRGLVLLRGVNEDDDGADSNGSGKTSLAMSILWALTGTIDPRPMQDSKVADVVNDRSKVARVTIRGDLNGKEFVVGRTKTSSKGRLTFELDGEDRTAQSIKETQALINEALGVPVEVVARALFHGQHAMNELLDASDVKFKEELSLVVPLDRWVDASVLARKHAKEASTRLAELEGMTSLRSQDLQSLNDKVKQLELVAEERFMVYNAAVLALQERSELLSSIPHGQSSTETQLEMKQVEAKIEKLEDERLALVAAQEQQRHETATKQKQAEMEVAKHLTTMKAAEHRVAELATKYSLSQQKVERLEQMWELDLSAGKPETISTPDRCPVCRQPLDSHPSLHSSIEGEIADALSSHTESRSCWDNAKIELLDLESGLARAKNDLETLKKADHNTSSRNGEVLLDIDSKIGKERNHLQHLSHSLVEKAQQVEESAGLHNLESEIVGLKTGWQYAQQQLDQVREEREACREWIKDMSSEKEKQSILWEQMKETAEMFSARGVQTFVLQNAMSALEVSAQRYLSQLSDGTQHLELTMAEKLERRMFLRNSDGTFSERPLGTLSGGQWRRTSLALQLGFIDLVANRLRCSVSVWDEPLTHLDEKGRIRVGGVFRRLLSTGKFSTILLILQDLAADELGESFDYVDEVRRTKDCSRVNVGDGLV